MSQLTRKIITNPLINTDGSITARPCNISHLAMVYGVDRRTFNKWTKPFKENIGERTTYFFTLSQVETIFTCIGSPNYFDSKKYESIHSE